MKRILESGMLVMGFALMVVGVTGAYFSDTERSTGNTFAAGVIDLKVDNESYYNGNKCEDVSTTQDIEDWRWVGEADYPVPGTPCSTSWLLDDLSNGYLFFNFDDVKPDDEGEDTISLHVGTNPSWACMDVSLTSNDDNSSNEPELETGDAQNIPGNTWDGELAENIQFIWWADDGDNVLETGENVLSDGVETLEKLAYTDGPFVVALADSAHNAWGLPVGTPLDPSTTYYIGKAWCFGTLTEVRQNQDFLGKTGSNGPMNRGTGVACDGTLLGNETQTDGVTLDIAFRALQERGTENFLCRSEQPRMGKLTVVKEVVNDNGGNNVVADFLLYVDNGITTTNVTSGVTNDLVASSYIVMEQGVQGYEATFSGDCDESGKVTVGEGESKTCTITNNDLPANITLFKHVVGGTALPTSFGLRIDGTPVSHNTSRAVLTNVPHTITEVGRVGYTFTGPITGVSNYGKSCPAVLGGSITLDEGEAIVCTITNTFTP